MDYVKELTGTLIKLEEDENARFRFEIWFDYTRRGINLVREGAMVAVVNFASNAQEQHLSILEIVTILPMHYGLGTDSSGYPGFVVEAAKSAALDWEEQEHEATEDTTKIKCVAIPTNFEFLQSAKPGESARLQEESNLPMVGASARLLDTASTEFVVNFGIRPSENTTRIGSLIRDDDVSVHVRIQELLKTHFGVFGFTGAGKSNLLSTLIAQALADTRDHIKLVFFDLMGEYNSLLIDQLCQLDDAMLIALHPETLPASTIDVFALPTTANPEEKRDAADRAVRDLVNTALLPTALSDSRSAFEEPYRQLLRARKIRVWREQNTTIGAFLNDSRPELMKGNLGGSKPLLNALFAQLSAAFGNQAFTEQTLTALLTHIDQWLAANQNLTATAGNNLHEFRQRLQAEGARLANQVPIPPSLGITIPELINRLNDHNNSGLYVVQAHDPDVLRHFSWMLGNFTYDRRRNSGQITPLVSFVFDEADEFIPQQAKDSYQESTDIAMTLARRGRKFGLGIGIATQRVRYLNTSIMAQPHTYLVSKMPRFTDRQAVSEAFGASEDMFRQTFKFKKGDWLLMSYDATGLEAIPIPIHLTDANERVRRFLENAGRSAKAAPAR